MFFQCFFLRFFILTNKFISFVIGNSKLEYLFNKKRHQYSMSECGMYCLHFMIYMLEGNNFMKYIKNKKSDEYIEKFRNVFFID